MAARAKKRANPPKLRSGYAYRAEGGASFRSVPNDDWDTVVVSPGDAGAFLGRRRIDGTECFVWEAKGGGYLAQTAVGANPAKRASAKRKAPKRSKRRSGARRRNPPQQHADATLLRRFRESHWGLEASGVKRAGAPDPRAGVTKLGELISIVYRGPKGTLEVFDWEHAFGTRGKGRPVLAYNESGLVIVGGTYTVNERGIVG